MIGCQHSCGGGGICNFYKIEKWGKQILALALFATKFIIGNKYKLQVIWWQQALWGRRGLDHKYQGQGNTYEALQSSVVFPLLYVLAMRQPWCFACNNRWQTRIFQIHTSHRQRQALLCDKHSTPSALFFVTCLTQVDMALQCAIF